MRGGSGALSLELEGSSAEGPWRTAIKTSWELRLSLRTWTLYAGTRFRLVAVNGAGGRGRSAQRALPD